MKKLLFTAAAAVTAMTCAFGLTACNADGAGSTEPPANQIEAVYQLYTQSAEASGDEVLSYEDWLESIKGATGATGATGKSAYEIAKENGFTGTETEWLASLKGADGAAGGTGATGKSAYEIAKENGFTGTEAQWLASLKGEKGDAGEGGSATACVEGIYETSDGLVVKFTDGTIKPVENGGAANPLLMVGENTVELPADKSVKTNFSFMLLTGGKYEIQITQTTGFMYNYFSVTAGNGNISEGKGSFQPRGEASGTWEDGTEYWAKQIDIMAGRVHTFTLINAGADTACKISIVKVAE